MKYKNNREECEVRCIVKEEPESRKPKKENRWSRLLERMSISERQG